MYCCGWLTVWAIVEESWCFLFNQALPIIATRLSGPACACIAFVPQFELFLRLFCFGRTSHLMGMKLFFDSLHFLDESENDRH
jgi:hypothetical protein